MPSLIDSQTLNSLLSSKSGAGGLKQGLDMAHDVRRMKDQEERTALMKEANSRENSEFLYKQGVRDEFARLQGMSSADWIAGDDTGSEEDAQAFLKSYNSGKSKEEMASAEQHVDDMIQNFLHSDKMEIVQFANTLQQIRNQERELALKEKGFSLNVSGLIKDNMDNLAIAYHEGGDDALSGYLKTIDPGNALGIAGIGNTKEFKKSLTALYMEPYKKKATSALGYTMSELSDGTPVTLMMMQDGNVKVIEGLKVSNEPKNARKIWESHLVEISRISQEFGNPMFTTVEEWTKWRREPENAKASRRIETALSADVLAKELAAKPDQTLLNRMLSNPVWRNSLSPSVANMLIGREDEPYPIGGAPEDKPIFDYITNLKELPSQKELENVILQMSQAGQIDVHPEDAALKAGLVLRQAAYAKRVKARKEQK